MLEREFKIGDKVRLHDPDDYSKYFDGVLGPPEDAPLFSREMGSFVKDPEGKRAPVLGPPYLPGPGDEYETLWSLHVENFPINELDYHPYPIMRCDLDQLETLELGDKE